MGTYYAFEGALTFASQREATEALATLRDQSFFWTPAPKTAKDLVVAGATLTFASKRFGGDYEEFVDVRILLRELSSKARAGCVRAQAGDGGPGTEVDYFGFKPRAARNRPSKAPAKKTAATKISKKAAAQKTSAKKR